MTSREKVRLRRERSFNMTINLKELCSQLTSVVLD